ncbi:hypothetical protein B0I29_13344 [Actinoplanes lutulentus]|uniref:Uncharacterized protein n=2 Tax=Actinoplanes lutulentus TaxID=1287878 RepID=A0A327YY02_9ACTN|nr:hypothetical protein B0I29_13344 [Actinoplanes lutulentus]
MILQMAQQLCDADAQEPTDREVRLAVLAAAHLLHSEVGAHREDAAISAAQAGADYVELGNAIGMTRQGARRRWPGLAAITRTARQL